MKTKRKINFGWLFIATFVLILLIIFSYMSQQISRAKSDLTKKTNSYYALIIPALMMNQEEINQFLQMHDDVIAVNELGKEIADQHWQKIASEISPLFSDQTTSDRHKKAFEDLFIHMLESKNIILDANQKTTETSSIKWNMLGQVQITNYYETQYKFSEIADNEFSKLEPLQSSSPIITWEKSNGEWRIKQADWVIPYGLLNQSATGFGQY